ncbi:MAG: phosphate ABC transporter ATP-binding protein [Acidobacteriota bacterium]
MRERAKGEPSANGRPLLQTEGLSLSYGRKAAFRDVSLAVPEGGISAIIGPSGCGKSSFLACLNRLSDLLPRCRVEGRVRVGEIEVFDPATDVIALRRRVGMIFQKPNPFPLSIRRNLELPLREHGVRDRQEIDAIIERTLSDVVLWSEVKDRLDASALALSGGQQQRLCLARALALEPEVVLLDEPCSALDPISSGVVEDLIARLGGRYTVVIVTHNLAQARRIADRVAFFWLRDGAGRLIEEDAAERVFEQPRDELTAAYVGGARG